jgi:Holliday junction DNA helicase RuvB
VKIDSAKFTLVGATTRAGLLTNPLRDRFGIPVRLNFYTEAELELIVNRGARVLGIGMTARRRQRDRAPLPRHAAHRRAAAAPRARFRLGAGADSIDRALADQRCVALEVDAAGLDAMDRRYSHDHREQLRRRPGRRRDHGGALSEPRDAIEDIIEPFLIQKGLLQRTPRGRLITSHAFKHLGLAEPARDPVAVRDCSAKIGG